MFDVGFAELFLLALIGLLVLGPERLPGVARTIGGYVRKARSSWISLRNTIESELAEADISAPLKKTGEELKQIGKDLAIDAKLAEADISAPLKNAGEELKQIGKNLADVPGFTPENRESLKPESHSQSGTGNGTGADPDADQKSEPVQDSNDRKDENV